MTGSIVLEGLLGVGGLVILIGLVFYFVEDAPVHRTSIEEVRDMCIERHLECIIKGG